MKTLLTTDVSFHVINLKSRKDRLDQFLSIIPSKIKPLINIFEAIDKSKVATPSSWKYGDGAYGCYLSHMELVKKHINSKYKYLCIFEDDVIFGNNFCEQFINYLDLLPNDTDQFFLGGQYHRFKPIEYSTNLYYNVPILRTHAYLTKTNSCQKIYDLLNEHLDTISLNNHIDHIYANAHWNNKITAYAPKRWICGQSAGRSDIAYDYNDMNRWWHVSPKKPKDVGNRLVIVLGLHGSGTSCVATILQKLGVYIGDKVVGYWSHKGGGGESEELKKICESIFRTPSIETNMSKMQIVSRLHGWIASHRNKGKQLGLVTGCKYPTLCAMSEYFKEIIDDKYLRIIHCDRPFNDSVNSMIKRGYDQDAITVHQEWLYKNKLEFLSRIQKDQIIDVNFQEMISDPAKTVEQIIKFLELKPSQNQINDAINHVKV